MLPNLIFSQKTVRSDDSSGDEDLKTSKANGTKRDSKKSTKNFISSSSEAEDVRTSDMNKVEDETHVRNKKKIFF